MFVVMMYRRKPGQEYFETHSYLLGVFYTYDQAKFNANAEMLARAGKYDAWIDYCVPGSVDCKHSFPLEKLGWVEYEYSEEVDQEVQRRYGKWENI